MNKHTVFVYGSFLLVAIIAIVLRTWKITAPVADWHSFRQADTASVARRFTDEGVNILVPKYHDLSNIQSGMENPQGYRMVEMPLYQASAVVVKGIFPMMPIEVALRIITIAASAFITVIIGVWVYKRVGWLPGMLSAFVYAVLPYSIFYGRSILPDTLMVALALGSVFTLDMTRMKKKHTILWFSVSMILASLALLVKPFAVFILMAAFPIFVSRFRWKGVIFFLLWLGIAFLPYVWWRGWIQQFKEGIPAGEWLLNGNGIRFKGSWFHWLFARRVGDLILGFWGLVPFGLGILWLIAEKGLWVFRTLLVGALLYFIVFATGNVQHDYYQILVIPVIAILSGCGLHLGLHIGRNGRIPFVNRGLFLSVCMIFGLMFSWFTVRTYYWINHPEIIEAGNAADALLPKNAKVIAPYNGDTAFLYQTKRNGWPVGSLIDEKIKLGATHYVTVSTADTDTETRDVVRDYTVLERNERFVIVDLTRKRENREQITENR